MMNLVGDICTWQVRRVLDLDTSILQNLDRTCIQLPVRYQSHWHLASGKKWELLKSFSENRILGVLLIVFPSFEWKNKMLFVNLQDVKNLILLPLRFLERFKKHLLMHLTYYFITILSIFIIILMVDDW